MMAIGRDLLLGFLVLDLGLLGLRSSSLGFLVLGSSAFSAFSAIIGSSGLVRLLRSTTLTLLQNGGNRATSITVLLTLSPKASDPVTDSRDGNSYKIGLAL